MRQQLLIRYALWSIGFLLIAQMCALFLPLSEDDGGVKSKQNVHHIAHSSQKGLSSAHRQSNSRRLTINQVPGCPAMTSNGSSCGLPREHSSFAHRSDTDSEGFAILPRWLMFCSILL